MKKTQPLFIGLFLLLIACKEQTSIENNVDLQPQGKENIAYKWGEMALLATANDTERNRPRPTITSRFLGLTFVAIFDAWSFYDTTALPVYALDMERRDSSEHTLQNKEIAISYAAYTALCEYYPADRPLYDTLMREIGLEPTTQIKDTTSPAYIGVAAAQAVIKARKNDGANQYGEEAGSKNTPYFNYTGYEPVNSADMSTDVMKWQPKYFADGKGGIFAPSCLTPFWNLVKPISLNSPDQFRPAPPPSMASVQLKKELEDVIHKQANLTDYQRALVEFMRDGPKSVQQAGHWLKFAQEVSVRDKHTLDQDVKMYFYNQVVAMDCFIASWDSKMYYDYARPYALVHHFYKGQKIKGWNGKTITTIDGSMWRPYSPDTFLCPPFPSYTSGHSTISAGCAQALTLWTGSDTFGSKATVVAGAMTDPDYKGETITLEFPTFSETAQMAGISRVYGGYHIQADNVAGLELGRNVANEAWKFYNTHIGATK